MVVDLVKCAPPPEIDIWMDAGRLDWLLDGNRQMYALLKEKKYRVNYREFSGGHNYTAWRDDIWHGLEAVRNSIKLENELRKKSPFAPTASDLNCH